MNKIGTIKAKIRAYMVILRQAEASSCRHLVKIRVMSDPESMMTSCKGASGEPICA